MTPTLTPPIERSLAGFTLIEMLVVLTIISLVAAMGAATLSRKPGQLERERIAGRIKLAIAGAERAAREQGRAASPDFGKIDGIDKPLVFQPTLGRDKLLTFFPDGSSTGGAISLDGRPLVEIDWLTGGAQGAH